MATLQEYITLKQLAEFHQVSVTLIHEFADFGLVEVTIIEEHPCISKAELERIERAIRLHQDLGVNKEGIEIILDMRNKQEELLLELTNLRHQVKKYEERIASLFLDNSTDY